LLYIPHYTLTFVMSYFWWWVTKPELGFIIICLLPLLSRPKVCSWIFFSTFFFVKINIDYILTAVTPSLPLFSKQKYVGAFITFFLFWHCCKIDHLLFGTLESLINKSNQKCVKTILLFLELAIFTIRCNYCDTCFTWPHLPSASFSLSKA